MLLGSKKKWFPPADARRFDPPAGLYPGSAFIEISAGI
jgi:hypothetical protein